MNAESPARSARAHLPGRIEALDGLRAVSILIVLFGHGAHTIGSPRWLQPMTNMGIVGVDLFFVISGFIITLLLIRERRSAPVSLRNFWLRRALRILPPFAAASAGLALAASLGLTKWSWPSFFGALTFTKDTTLFPGDWFFGHTWSLSVEEQFYILWPLIFILAAPVTATAPLLPAVLIASPVLAWICTRHWQAVQNLLPFIPYLAAGCLLALRRWRGSEAGARRLRATRLALITPCALGFAYLNGEHIKSDLSMPLASVLLPLWGYLLVDECIRSDGVLRGLLKVRALRWLGMISYSVYLWQQLFLGPPDAYIASWFWNRWPQNIVAGVACGGLAYLLVERPGARLKRFLLRSGQHRLRVSDRQPPPSGNVSGTISG